MFTTTRESHIPLELLISNVDGDGKSWRLCRFRVRTAQFGKVKFGKTHPIVFLVHEIVEDIWSDGCDGWGDLYPVHLVKDLEKQE